MISFGTSDAVDRLHSVQATGELYASETGRYYQFDRIMLNQNLIHVTAEWQVLAFAEFRSEPMSEIVSSIPR